MEFTKRKRYADLVVAETALTLVLSPQREIWYVGGAQSQVTLSQNPHQVSFSPLTVTLGNIASARYNTDVLDGFLNPEDVRVFCEAFDDALEENGEEWVNVRMRGGVQSVKIRLVKIEGVNEEEKEEKKQALVLAVIDPLTHVQRQQSVEPFSLGVPKLTVAVRFLELFDEQLGVDQGLKCDDSALEEAVPPEEPLEPPVQETGPPRKRTKSETRRVCVQCGQIRSPEWRKGPNGPKTLCNACGLKWAKRSKVEGTPS